MSAKAIAQAVHRLEGNQLAAVAPRRTVWLSASAGTGKTQVLTSRVLRLLLEPGVAPDQILCLTFTKAGAAEMATRIGAKLAEWVRLDETGLAAQLQAIGADFAPEARVFARSRFAAVLDSPGGGLRIGTIHAFAQWLLAAFPDEAGLAPGTRAMEDRDRDLLLREVLADLLLAAEAGGDQAFIDDLAALSLRMGEAKVPQFLLRCAAADAPFGLADGWRGDLRSHVNRLLGLPEGADQRLVADVLDDRAFPRAALDRACAALRAWGTITANAMLDSVGAWLALAPMQRAQALPDLQKALFNAEGAPKRLNNLVTLDPAYGDHLDDVARAIEAANELARSLALADRLVPALGVGRRFAQAWDAAKAREGFVDFDDQIRAAAGLLTTRTSAEWIRFKLDRRFDHILVDEAQDTNPAQWDIVLKGLTGDFFAGAGKPMGEAAARTLFVVGDYKQAIFRFQGTDPVHFEAARQTVQRQLADLAQAADDPSQELLGLELDRSFRSAQSVLDCVDRVLDTLGHARLGLPAPPDRHRGLAIAGQVQLWQPVSAQGDDAGEDDEGAETWLSNADRVLAGRIARRVRRWLDEGFALTKGAPRRALPGDIMVLVRRRGDLAGLIVARLHAEGVPVAGIDRLRIGAPLAVRDLIAALRFAAQPLDDLNLANLLVSPLIGWSQDDLLRHGWRESGVRLWDHLRRSESAETHGAMTALRDLLARADILPVPALLNWVLVGPWQGRQRLLARLGAEAGDPIDELVNATLAHASAHTPSLAGFLQWFAAGDGDVKREGGGSADLVRVMTAHGSKGLQAPIVILADATGDPDRSPLRDLTLADALDRKVPLPPLRKAEKPARVRDAEAAASAADREEHWRLLYVAMTRAEEALFVAGALRPADAGVVPAQSWYAALEQALPHAVEAPDPEFGLCRSVGTPAPLPPRDRVASAVPEAVCPALLFTPIGPEPRPPRPLAPSALGEDEAPAAPRRPGPGAQTAARRGTLLHALLERLPDVPAPQRAAAARAWLARTAPDHAGDDIVEAALAVIAHPDWADVFGPGSIAEAPIAALVGDRLVSGTIDRLVIAPDRVRIVDFKTDRRPPADAAAIPAAYLRQMAAYAAAMVVIAPGRTIEAALLFTAIPRLYVLDAGLLAAHKFGDRA